MRHLTEKDINLFAQKILEDYDTKNPGTIFKDKIKISNADALLLQSTVSKLREKRGEEIIGYKIGCVLKETQKKMGFMTCRYWSFFQPIPPSRIFSLPLLIKHEIGFRHLESSQTPGLSPSSAHLPWPSCPT